MRIQKLMLGTNADGRLELFALIGGTLWHRWQLDNGKWSDGLTSFGGTDLKRVALARNEDGRLEVIALGGDYVVYHKWQISRNKGWSDWDNFDEKGTEIAIANNEDRRLEIFIIDGLGRVKHCWQPEPNSMWSGWDFLPAYKRFPDYRGVCEQLVAILNGNNLIEVFARGQDGSLQHSIQAKKNGEWGETDNLGGTIQKKMSEFETDKLAVARDHLGLLHVFAIPQGGNGLRRLSQTTNGWDEWRSLPRPPSGIEAVHTAKNDDGRIEVFAVSNDSIMVSGVPHTGGVYHMWQTKVHNEPPVFGWTPDWARFPGYGLPRTVCAGIDRSGCLQLFTATNDIVDSISQSQRNGGWNENWNDPFNIEGHLLSSAAA